MTDLPPLLTLLVGMGVVLGLIIGLRANAFVALITAALVVSFMAPGESAATISRVAVAFGGTAGGIGIVIAFAALIARFMMDSGAADRIVRFFLGLLGEKRGGTALAASGFALSIPVFFDTVFYLLVPLARSMARRTKKHYLKYLMAIVAGAGVTHTLVPPTPGPLVMADTLNVDLGVMMIIGALIGLPAAVVGLVFAAWVDRRMPLPMRRLNDAEGSQPVDDAPSPSLFWSFLPILLPIVMVTTGSVLLTRADAEHAARFRAEAITDWSGFASAVQQEDFAPGQRLLAHLPETSVELISNSAVLDDEGKAAIVDGLNGVLGDRGFYAYESFVGIPLSETCRSLLKRNRGRMQVALVERFNRLLLEASFPQITPHVWDTPRRRAANIGAVWGNPSLALMLASVAALWVYIRQRHPTREKIARTVESALMSGGVIILITAAGGAFGAMLGQAQIGPAIQDLFADRTTVGGMGILVLAFAIASMLKFAQGSSTVAMIAASSMVAAMIDPDLLGFHPVYLATAVGSGSLVGSWMNDSGFWIFCKMGGLTEAESLKSWTPLLAVCGISAMLVTLILSVLLPMAPG